MLVRNLVLPFLLGFKFSLSSLIPLVFGIVLLVTKKALLLTKIALLLSGLLGWNSILTSGGYQGGHPGSPTNLFSHGPGGFHFPNSHGYDFLGGAGGVPPHHDHHDHHYPFRPYRTAQQTQEFPSYGQHVVREVVNVYESGNDKADRDSPRDGKNFVWSTGD